MARKSRDYKAEYARRKARAQASGKTRDYKAEYARRNERAKAKGFTSASQEKRVKRASKTGRYHPAMAVAARNPEFYGFVPKTVATIYAPENAAKLGISVEEYTRAYYEAFLSGPQKYALNRKHGSPAMKRWFVDITGYMSEKDYDAKYH